MKLAQTKTYLFLLTSIALFFGACVVLVGMWFFVTAKTGTLEESLTSAAERDAEETQMAKFSQLLEGTADNRTLLKSFVLADTDVINFISHLESIAQARGLTIKTQTVTTSAIEGSTLFETLNLNLQVAGNKQRIMDLVSYLEHLPYQTSIPNFTLERMIGTEKWTGTFVLHITKTIAHE